MIHEGRRRTVEGVERKKAGKRAQQRAYASLAAAHRDEYRVLYLAELAAEGFPARPSIGDNQ